MLFFFNDTATTEIYTLSLHDALPISRAPAPRRWSTEYRRSAQSRARAFRPRRVHRSEEHTSELQSPCNLVCRLLLEKKKNKHTQPPHSRHLQSRRQSLAYHSCRTARR